MALPTVVTLYKKNDQYIEIDGLADGIDGAFKNAATITATLKDSAGQVVEGFDALPFAYVIGTDGNYRCQVEETFDPAEGNYTLMIDASQGGYVGHWEIKAKVKIRKS